MTIRSHRLLLGILMSDGKRMSFYWDWEHKIYPVLPYIDRSSSQCRQNEATESEAYSIGFSIKLLHTDFGLKTQHFISYIICCCIIIIKYLFKKNRYLFIYVKKKRMGHSG